jgi:outer membrane protein TolC
MVLIVLNIPLMIFAQQKSLEDIVLEALQNNPELLSAESELKSVKADFWTSISPESPEIFTEYEGLPENDYSFSKYDIRKTGIAQGIEFPLTYYLKGRKSHWEKSIHHADYITLRNKLISKVKKAYYQLLRIIKQIRIYREIESLTLQNVEKTRIRVLSGESSSYDSLKVKVDLIEVVNRVLSLEHVKKLAVSELLILLGRSEESMLEISGELEFSTIHLNQDSIRIRMLESHPLLKKEYAVLRQKCVMRNLSWNQLLPDFHVRYFQIQYGDDPNRKAWGGELGLKVPLWFFLKEQGNIRSANYKVQSAQWKSKNVENNLLLQVEKAIARYQIAVKQVVNYRNYSLKEVEELVRIATRSYEEGEMSYLELSDALSAMHRVRIGYTDALYDYFSALSDLEEAAGFQLF